MKKLLKILKRATSLNPCCQLSYTINIDAGIWLTEKIPSLTKSQRNILTAGYKQLALLYWNLIGVPLCQKVFICKLAKKIRNKSKSKTYNSSARKVLKKLKSNKFLATVVSEFVSSSKYDADEFYEKNNDLLTELNDFIVYDEKTGCDVLKNETKGYELCCT